MVLSFITQLSLDYFTTAAWNASMVVRSEFFAGLPRRMEDFSVTTSL